MFLAASIAALSTVPAVAVAGPASAAVPAGNPTVVILGDSYISGEAGRWAGNTNSDSSRTDALGSSAYWDTPTGEAIANCHRSKVAEVFITVPGVDAVNLACSGAKTGTTTSGDFKPGIDFYSDTSGRKGQARALQDLAATKNVKLVVLSIGGNDFNFASIVQTCVTNFLLSPSWWPDYCYDDSSVSSNFTTTAVSNNTTKIRTAIQNVKAAMANSGYAASDWKLVVQTYPSPIPKASGFRYSQSGYTRQNTGGCGFWNRDADWANDTAIVKINGAVRSAATAEGVPVLELQSAFNGRRLCENTVGLLEEKSVATWQSTGAADKTEWIAQIRTVSTVFGPYQVQESIHPNYWGQQALQSCVRQVWNNGTVRGGTCRISGTGLVNGEPVMTLS
jgi:hypothetical protein